MEQKMKVLTDKEAERVVGGNNGLISNISMGELGATGESEQSELVNLPLNHGGDPIYSPLKQSSQSSNAVSQKLITSHRLPIQAGIERDKKTSSVGKNSKFQMPSDGLYVGGVTFELTKKD